MAPSLNFHLTATARPPAISVVSWGSWSGASGQHLQELRVFLGTVPTPSGGQAGWRWDGLADGETLSYALTHFSGCG